MTPKIFERTYLELKREVTSGRYKPGQRLQARGLADVLRTSTSPVTNAMRQLVGERVLEYTSDGFIVPWVNEQRLRDLFTWSAWLSTVGPPEFDDHGTNGKVGDLTQTSDVVATTEHLFLAIALPLQNAELTRNVENANDRLRGIRILERGLIAEREDELSDLNRLRLDAKHAALVGGINHYYRRRLDAVPQLVGLSYQDRS